MHQMYVNVTSDLLRLLHKSKEGVTTTNLTIKFMDRFAWMSNIEPQMLEDHLMRTSRNPAKNSIKDSTEINVVAFIQIGKFSR